MQPGRPAEFGAGAELLAQRLFALRRGGEAFEERSEIEASSSRDDREAASSRDLAEGLTGAAGVVAGGAGFVRRVEVDAVVRDTCALGEGGLGGADLHAAIDGDGVAGDDFAGESLGEGGASAILPLAVGPATTTAGSLARGLPKPPPACGEDAMHAGAENGEDNGGEGEQKQAAKLAAAWERFGCAGRLCFARVGGVGRVQREGRR